NLPRWNASYRLADLHRRTCTRYGFTLLPKLGADVCASTESSLRVRPPSRMWPADHRAKRSSRYASSEAPSRATVLFSCLTYNFPSSQTPRWARPQSMTRTSLPSIECQIGLSGRFTHRPNVEETLSCKARWKP